MKDTPGLTFDSTRLGYVFRRGRLTTESHPQAEASLGITGLERAAISTLYGNASEGT